MQELYDKIKQLNGQGAEYAIEVAQLLHHTMSMPLVADLPLEKRLGILGMAAALVLLEEEQRPEVLEQVGLRTGKLIGDVAKLWLTNRGKKELDS